MKYLLILPLLMGCLSSPEEPQTNARIVDPLIEEDPKYDFQKMTIDGEKCSARLDDVAVLWTSQTGCKSLDPVRWFKACEDFGMDARLPIEWALENVQDRQGSPCSDYWEVE